MIASGQRRPAPETGAEKVKRAIREELLGLHPRLSLAGAFARSLPPLAFQRARTALYRMSGISIGARSLIAGPLDLIGPGDISSRLSIGSDCWLNTRVFADLTGQVTIGDRVSIGHHVVIITAHHAIGPSSRRAGPVVASPVVIEDGAWVGSGATLLPGACVGAGSVIGAGSLVAGKIPPNVVAVGTPARVVRDLAERANTWRQGPQKLGSQRQRCRNRRQRGRSGRSRSGVGVRT